MEHNCHTCKSGYMHQCKILKSQPEYQIYQLTKEVNQITAWNILYVFEKNFICEKYEKRYIEYPIEVTKINYDTKIIDFHEHDIGKFVSIKWCHEDHKDKTYLGLFLGDLPLGIKAGYNSDSEELNLKFDTNPAIFVFALNKIIYGAESFWSIIESEEDLKEITQETIDNQWYIKALKSLTK